MTTTETVNLDNLWRDAWYIAWVGACNPRAVENTRNCWAAHVGLDHPAVRAMTGHLAFLLGTSLGPESDDLENVKVHAQSMGLFDA